MEKSPENVNVAPQNAALQIKQMEYELSPIGQEMRRFEMVQRKAQMYAQSSMVPKTYQGKIADCAIAVDMALRMGADVLMVMQNLYVVNGNPSFSAKFLIAALNDTGKFSPLDYVWNGKDGLEKGCHAEATRKSDGKVLRGPDVTMKMAKDEGWLDKPGSKWKTMPDLMMMYRAAAFFQRLYAPEVSMGFLTTEEVRDMPETKTEDVTYEDVTEMVANQVSTEQAEVPGEETQTEEVVGNSPAGNQAQGQQEMQMQGEQSQQTAPKPRKPAFGSN